MFANLTDKLTKALRDLRGLSKLSEENIAPALTEVRSALMSADVNFKVAKDFTERVKVACLGQAVIESVNPGQMAVKIVSDELTKLLGEGERPIDPRRPLRVLLVGLQGSGKTTSAAKLAKHLVKKEGIRKPSLVAADLRRPAAIDQLETLAKNEGFDFRADRAATDVAAMVGRLVKEAEGAAADLVIVDTAGRLQIDGDLMEEVRRVRDAFQPHEVFLVADAALGQQAVDVAAKFHESTPLTGIILTKLDGDARGGAALSMKSVTGVPIRYMGTGEKSSDFDTFHPDRMAQRILGMGDVVSLVEKAQEVVDHKEAERLAEKMKKADFDLEDFLAQMSQMKKMGPLGDIMKMMPGMGGIQVGAKEEKHLAKTEAIVLSMTKKERRNPDILNGSRRQRIAKGSGTQVSDVNALIKQFSQMREMMRMMKGGKGKELMRRMSQMGGGRGGMPGGGFPGGGFPRHALIAMSKMIPFDPALLSRPGWIFDCDGTLAASMWIHHRSWTHIVSKQIGRPFDFPWPLFCSMGGMSAVDTCQRLKADYGFDLNVDQLLADGHEFLEEHLAKDVTARHEVVAVVHHVRGLGHKTAVASAGRRDHVHTTLKRIDITHLFDAVITAEDAPRSKPHPDLFLAAAGRLGLKPADCVVIEDSPRGKEAADAAGMPCILVEPA